MINQSFLSRSTPNKARQRLIFKNSLRTDLIEKVNSTNANSRFMYLKSDLQMKVIPTNPIKKNYSGFVDFFKIFKFTILYMALDL